MTLAALQHLAELLRDAADYAAAVDQADVAEHYRRAVLATTILADAEQHALDLDDTVQAAR